MRTSVLIDALKNGEKITNGPQYIQFYPETGDGYMWCDTPECCYYTFDSLDEIAEYVDDDWSIDVRLYDKSINFFSEVMEKST